MKIQELAKIFSSFRTYPIECYGGKSSVKVFQKMFWNNYYSQDLETFLSLQNYVPEQRGADLPWWGNKFFTQEKGFRIMIVAQDSLAKDAGSIVLFTHLMQIIESRNEYERYTDQTDRNFKFNNWNTIKTQLTEWGINFDFSYITDAKKVYRKGSWEDRDFDTEQSRKLLETEITFCDPDLIIILGQLPLRLLNNNIEYASVFTNKSTILIRGKKCVVSPFLIGNGRTQLNFQERLEIATDLIKKEIVLSKNT